MTVGEALLYGYTTLAGNTPSSRLDAELLLSYVTSKERLALISHPEILLSEKEKGDFKDAISRRAQNEPIGYIIGRKEFWGFDLLVNKNVLIPRPETEVLVEQALKLIDTLSGSVSILDLGTGSGAIAIALASELRDRHRDFTLIAVDKSEESLKVAYENLRRFGLQQQVSLKQSDWFSAISTGEKFDLIVANPPYIAAGDSRVSKELAFEPRQALFAGHDGLTEIKRIIESAADYLTSRGQLMVEFGIGQEAALVELLRDHEFNYHFVNDYSSSPRVFVAYR